MMTPVLEDYLALRRAAGFQLCVQEVHLRNFVKFAAERGEAFVRTQTALEWAALAPSASQRGHRLDVVRIFARYATLEDSGHEVPPVGAFSSRRPPYRPFIFTDEQILPGRRSRAATADRPQEASSASRSAMAVVIRSIMVSVVSVDCMLGSKGE
jgi:hypothetical protein